ncbi:MAG: LysR family transcriptional regulator [Azospirillaceae bacterium]|nr:LysR family transcriptional regulator [Azospirillaceae bacterium]
MDLRALRAFVEVVRHGGFSAAARVIHTTQPTISKAIKQLEEELGAPLLDRLGHRVQMTAVGEVVYRRAIAMLSERETLIGELAELRGLSRGRLRLGLPQFGSSFLFAPLFAEYRIRHPGIDIELIEDGSRRLEEAVLAGEIELAVSLLPVPIPFAWQEVRNEPMVALLPDGHPLAGRDKVKLVELADSPLILFESGFALNELIEDACRRRGFSPREAARSGQADFIVALVAAGLGVALLPRLTAEQRHLASVHMAQLDDDDLRWHAVLIWRRDGYLSPAARAWLALAAEGTPGQAR